MGFFECLDNKANKVLGMSQTDFSHNLSETNQEILGWSELVEQLSQKPSLETIRVRNNKLCSADMQVLSGTLMRYHQLHVMDFSGNPLGIRGLATLLDCCRGNMELKELHLADLGLSAEMSEADCEVVCRTFDDFPSLQVLDLSGNNLSLDLLRTLALSINDHPNLHRLYLERNGVVAATAPEILRFISSNVVLHTIHFGNSKGKGLKNRGGTTLAKSSPLKMLKRGFKTVNKLALVEALSHNVSIRSLQLDGVTAQEQSKIVAFLQQNEQIWAHRANNALIRVSLSGRQLNYVPPSICTLEMLSELDLSNNALEAVPLEITRLKLLSWLSLEKNEIHHSAAPFHLLELKKLRYLNLSGNPMVADLPRTRRLTTVLLSCRSSVQTCQQRQRTTICSSRSARCCFRVWRLETRPSWLRRWKKPTKSPRSVR